MPGDKLDEIAVRAEQAARSTRGAVSRWPAPAGSQWTPAAVLSLITAIAGVLTSILTPIITAKDSPDLSGYTRTARTNALEERVEHIGYSSSHAAISCEATSSQIEGLDARLEALETAKRKPATRKSQHSAAEDHTDTP